MIQCKYVINLFKKDLTSYFRHPSDIIYPALFYIILVSIFFMALRPSTETLHEIDGPVILWIACLLSILLSLETLFENDYNDGSLEQLVLSEYSLSILLLIKLTTHWIARIFPLIILTPIISIFFHLKLHSMIVLVAMILLSTPILCLIGGVGVSLTLGLNQGGFLLMIILIPLMIPVTIFGLSGVIKAMHGLNYGAELKILAAFLILSVCLLPKAISSIIKMSVE